MTADVTALVRIPTAHDIATADRFTSGTWDDGQGRNLVTFLTFHVGPSEAGRLLGEADDIVRSLRYTLPPKLPAPTVGVDIVWTHNGVDHDPIPLRQVTVCGYLIPPPFVYDRAAGMPCGDCYGAVS